MNPLRCTTDRVALWTAVALLLSAILSGCGGSGGGGGTAPAPGGGSTPMIESIGLALVAENLDSPVALVESPDGSGRLFILEQAGLIRILLPDGTLQAQPFLDLQSLLIQVPAAVLGRGDFLGLAFHPNFAINGRFFVYYSAPLRAAGPIGFDHTNHISEFLVNLFNPDLADPASEIVLLQVDQPRRIIMQAPLSSARTGSFTFPSETGEEPMTSI